MNSDYKQHNIEVWDEVAPRYHKKWSESNTGPFRSAKKLVEQVGITRGDTVLDVACGTGIVIDEIQKKVGNSGHVIGVDTSRTAIKIAKKRTGIEFVNIDAEKFFFAKKFDIVTCQYALFYFQDAHRALKNMRSSLKRSGKIGISVHGKRAKIPYVSSIGDVVVEYISDYGPADSPDFDRFGTKAALKSQVSKAGFSSVTVKEFVFHHSPGKFEDYWRGYLRYIAKPLRAKIDGLSLSVRRELIQTIREKTIPYTGKDGNILFPWQVLILSAKN